MSVGVCVDASVAVKWLIPEVDAEAAATMLRDSRGAGDQFIAPPHLSSEVPSAIYKRVRSGSIPLERAQRLLISFSSLRIEYLAPVELASRALTIATSYNLKWIYDAYYVALAELADCDLWTADASLHRTLRDDFPRIRLLGEYGS